MNANKSITERIFQAIGFELLAIVICTPLLAWIMDKPMLDMGVVTVVIAALALAWNVIFNGIFDRVLARFEIAHNAGSRIVHALLFEGVGCGRRAADCLVAQRQLVAGIPAGYRGVAVFPAVHLRLPLGI